MAGLAEIVALLERWYSPRWAESWDSVGLIRGQRVQRPVTTVLVAVDPVPAVVAEAGSLGAELLVVHHPLLLGGTDRISGPRGGVLDTLACEDRALYVAHTNADVAPPGVSDALGAAIGLEEMRPLVVQDDEFDVWVVHVPAAHTEAVLDAMAEAGAGRLGAYERCAFVARGTGTFRPLAGAQPYLGQVGSVEQVVEDRIEMVALPSRRSAIAAAVRAAHPYEEPSLAAYPTRTPSPRGLGRIGLLPESLSLQDFAAHVAGCLPATAGGVRASGAPDTEIRTVAVVGGSGLELADAAAQAGADVLVTSDAKHHRAQDAPIPVLDVAHWAGEWPWTEALGARLRAARPELTVVVSELVTDPWTCGAAARSTARTPTV